MDGIDSHSMERLEKWEQDYVSNSEKGIIKNAFGIARLFIKPHTDTAAKAFKPLIESELVERIQKAVQLAVEGAFQFTHDNIKYTYNKKSILQALDIDSRDNLYEFNADDIEKHVRKIANQNKVASSVEGFGLGMGGLEATLLEIPIFFCLIVRVQQQICASYGYDPESDFEQSYMLKALSFSDAIIIGGKAELLLEMNILKVAIRRNTYKQLQEMGGKFALPQIAKKYAAEQGIRLSKKKMTQAIPLVGGVIGGLFNYGYISRAINVTNNLYKKRFLEDKEIILREAPERFRDVFFDDI